MFRTDKAARGAFVLTAAVALVTACSPRPSVSSSLSQPPFKEVAGVKLLMNTTIDPQADHLWDAVGFVMTLGEEDQEIRPETDEEWAAVRNAAVTLAESGNLLMMERRAMDEDSWMTFSRELIDTSEEAMAAANAKDPDALFVAGGHIYQACLTCHETYIATDDYAPPAGPIELTSIEETTADAATGNEH